MTNTGWRKEPCTINVKPFYLMGEKRKVSKQSGRKQKALMSVVWKEKARQEVSPNGGSGCREGGNTRTEGRRTGGCSKAPLSLLIDTLL